MTLQRFKISTYSAEIWDTDWDVEIWPQMVAFAERAGRETLTYNGNDDEPDVDVIYAEGRDTLGLSYLPEYASEVYAQRRNELARACSAAYTPPTPARASVHGWWRCHRRSVQPIEHAGERRCIRLPSGIWPRCVAWPSPCRPASTRSPANDS